MSAILVLSVEGPAREVHGLFFVFFSFVFLPFIFSFTVSFFLL